MNCVKVTYKKAALILKGEGKNIDTIRKAEVTLLDTGAELLAAIRKDGKSDWYLRGYHWAGDDLNKYLG